MAGLSWPTNVPSPRWFTFDMLDEVVGDASAFTGAREVMLRWQQWQFQLDWEAQPYLDALSRDGHLHRSDGGRIIYQVPVFHYRRQRGNKSGSVTFSGAHAAGATSWTITGGTGTLSRGDWVQVLYDTDVPHAYEVVSSESGGVIQVRPGARKAFSGGSVIHHLASVPDGWIKDTMERVTQLGGSRYEVSPYPIWAGPLSCEFVTALRLSP